MNHKRKRPKHQRAGCLLCKPHKDNGVTDLKHSDKKKGIGWKFNYWGGGYFEPIERISPSGEPVDVS